jgi:hypothetical protein
MIFAQVVAMVLVLVDDFLDIWGSLVFGLLAGQILGNLGTFNLY